MKTIIAFLLLCSTAVGQDYRYHQPIRHPYQQCEPVTLRYNTYRVTTYGDYYGNRWESRQLIGTRTEQRWLCDRPQRPVLTLEHGRSW